jgi:hypothetical protein
LSRLVSYPPQALSLRLKRSTARGQFALSAIWDKGFCFRPLWPVKSIQPHPDKKTPPLIQQTKDHFKAKQDKSAFFAIFYSF